MNIFRNIKDTGKKVIDKANDFSETFNGGRVIDSVEEYCNVYSEILIGMDSEIQNQNKLIDRYKNDMKMGLFEIKSILNETKIVQKEIENHNQLIQKHESDMIATLKMTKNIQKDIEKRFSQIKVVFWLSIFAIILSIVAIIGAILCAIIYKN